MGKKSRKPNKVAGEKKGAADAQTTVTTGESENTPGHPANHWPALNTDCGLGGSVVGLLAGVQDLHTPQDSDEELSKIPGYFESRGKMMPTLSDLAAAYRYDFSEDFVATQMAYWTALYANIESACARQRRRAARLPTPAEALPHPVEALLAACRDGDLDQIRSRLESGCNIDAIVSLPPPPPDSQCGATRVVQCGVLTPLFSACVSNQIEVARLLVNRGADVELTTPEGRLTALHVACIAGNYGMVCLLIFVGRATVDCMTDDGGTPLSIASSDGHLSIARLLIDRGADVNRTYENGFTALHLASKNGHAKVARLLIDRGAEINAATADGETSFFAACEENHYDVVELLMQKGAITNKAAEGGILPLEIALSNGHYAVAELLRPGIVGALEDLYARPGICGSNDGQLLAEHIERSGDDSQLSAEHAAALAPLRARLAERKAAEGQ